MPDRDLLEIFDAALPRLETYKPGSVPRAGAGELVAHDTKKQQDREVFGILTGATAAFAFLTWFMWMPWLPIWILGAMVGVTGASGLAAARAFLKLAFGKRIEQALPPGTDVKTAQLEDGTWSLIRYWNYDVFIWNGRVDALRAEVSDWQRFKDVPEARDIEWTEKGSVIQAEGLIAAIQGLASDRAALVARRDEIEHRLHSLDTRLSRLKASEDAPTLALNAPASEDPTDDG